MSFEPDIANDCLLIDGTESVTLEGTATVNVACAKRGAVSGRELMQPQLGLTADDVTWSIPDQSLAGIEPRVGDVLRDSTGTGWVLLTVSRSSLTRVWRAVCRKQR